MTISAGSDETQVGMARCVVPAAFSGGTLLALRPRIDRLVKRPFRACAARGRRSAASLPSLRCNTISRNRRKRRRFLRHCRSAAFTPLQRLNSPSDLLVSQAMELRASKRRQRRAPLVAVAPRCEISGLTHSPLEKTTETLMNLVQIFTEKAK